MPATASRTGLLMVCPYDSQAPSTRVRVGGWARHFENRDIDVVTTRGAGKGASSSRGEIGAALRGYVKTAAAGIRTGQRSVLIQKEASVLSRGELERVVWRGAERRVLDLDDAVHLAPPGGIIKQTLRPRAKVLDLVARADHVIVSNDYLAEFAASTATDVTVVPSCVEPRDYRTKYDYSLGNEVRLVWIGSRTTELYLCEILPALDALRRRLPLSVTLIGAKSGVADRWSFVTRVPWSESSQHELLGTFDVGLMPVPATDFTRGKAAYKLLQYMAAGLPAIATDWGVGGRLARNLGMPAPQAVPDWELAIEEVVQASDGWRSGVADRGRRLVSAEFSYGAWADRWSEGAGYSLVGQDPAPGG